VTEQLYVTSGVSFTAHHLGDLSFAAHHSGVLSFASHHLGDP
jgi:hypothetical protein